jgi:predicted amidohydrolase
MGIDEKVERITGVALLTSDGRMVALPGPHRHSHLYAVSALLGIDPDHAGHQSGFTTDAGRFVGREEGVGIATAANQLIRKTDPPSQLFSEDLW